MDIRAMAKEQEEAVVAFRRELHAHPELSMEEVRTTEKIAAEMEKLGIPYRRFSPTGLLAEIRGEKPGKTVALRADIDALPIQEATGLPFASAEEGKMHACGHDTHAAMLMGAARVLCQLRKEIPGTVKLLFQPAEESFEGARAVIAQGALEGVDAIFGLHIIAGQPAGTLLCLKGATMAAADTFRVTLKGRTSHGAMPEMGVDATLAAAAVVMNLQSIVSREMPASQSVVMTVGKLVSGTRSNIVSGEAYMEGTARCFDREIHEKLPEIFTRIVQSTAAAYRCTAEINYRAMTDVMVNHPLATEVAYAAAQKAAPDAAMAQVSDAKAMGSEDFAEYTAHTTAGFATLGGGGEYPQHNERFVVEESALVTGVAFYAQVALEFLGRAD